MIISCSIKIEKYGHGTYQIVAQDKHTPYRAEIVVDRDDLRKLRDEIDGMLGK